jgi:hypothetical protein
MTLREELQAVSREEAEQAYLEHLETADVPDGLTVEEYIERYTALLEDYPPLKAIFRLMVEATTHPDHETELTEQVVTITSAGVALAGIKAIANRQGFKGLEVPPNLR